MNDLYLVTGTSVLNDATFIAYGGQTGTSTPAMRGAAYQIAEQFAVQEIGTPLTPTTLTGTFVWPADMRLQLPYSRVSQVLGATALYDYACGCNPLELSGCAWLIDPDNGVIDIAQCGGAVGAAACNCTRAMYGMTSMPKLVRVVYIAGIPAGQVAANAGALMGLVTAADLALQQMMDCGPDGDPMITNFSDTGYSESRDGLIMTAFGGSARANFAARMVRPLKYKGALKLG